MSDEGVDSTVAERLVEDLLARAPGVPPTELTALVNEYARALGLRGVEVFLIDLQQRRLVPLDGDQPALDVDTSPPGWVYRTLTQRVDESGDEIHAWFPLVDGVERLGVVGVRTARLDAAALRRCRALVSLLALLVTSKRMYSDSYVKRTRAEPMQLPSEMLRAFLPPRTVSDGHAVSTAILEPAYELGGDAFDHALTGDCLYATILDSMGHDLASGLTTAVATAGCRNARRVGAELPELAESVDSALDEWLPDRFCTGIFMQLSLADGRFRWCNCGHPTPVLIRDEKVVEGAFERTPQPPMGMPARLAEIVREVHEVQLLPGDRVFCFTDGVTEGRVRDGAEFGLTRFTESVIRATAAGEPAPETLRRLMHAILDRDHNQLQDDATIMLVEWRPRQSPAQAQAQGPDAQRPEAQGPLGEP
ncbi:PP2C family protein-serine/threonine phosphatase [Phaeacidiphilus oryzae]|uniref:PP2C family protein-serine/threonine phosphatase n=1 Tax=Phaeacidiphilus oryzae TaxID=348818 RepID=UPI0006897F87|nr:PP2C family protein-serine/threonine phosphatase [Phaeacidiphilus oryzae]